MLGLILAGLVARALAQPWLAGHPSDALGSWLRATLVMSAMAELAGAALAIAMLGRVLWPSQNLPRKAELRAVFPLFAVGLLGFPLALLANAAGVVDMAFGGGSVMDARLNDFAIQLAFYAFLVPISVAMSVRTFPLYVRTAPPCPLGLRVIFALLVTGLVLRASGDLLSWSAVGGLGRLVLALGIAAAILVLGVFGRRVPLPRREVRVLTDPVQLHIDSAYGWLAFVGVVLVNAGFDHFGWRSYGVAETIEWHALGAGFVTILIVGVGQVLLPGFARRPLFSRNLLWATLPLGNAAAVLRIVPVLAGDRLQHDDSMLAISGILGLSTLCVFAVNIGVLRWWTRQE